MNGERQLTRFPHGQTRMTRHPTIDPRSYRMKSASLIASAFAALVLATAVAQGAAPAAPSPEVSVYLNPD